MASTMSSFTNPPVAVDDGYALITHKVNKSPTGRVSYLSIQPDELQ